MYCGKLKKPTQPRQRYGGVSTGDNGNGQIWQHGAFVDCGTDEIEVHEVEKVNQDLSQALVRKVKHRNEAQDQFGGSKLEDEDSHNPYRKAFRIRLGESYAIVLRRTQNREGDWRNQEWQLVRT